MFSHSAKRGYADSNSHPGRAMPSTVLLSIYEVCDPVKDTRYKDRYLPWCRLQIATLGIPQLCCEWTRKPNMLAGQQ